MRKTRPIGQDIERWWKVNEVQIPGTKDALYRAFLDSLTQIQRCPTQKQLLCHLLKML
jgi:hypothetical protein